jgi:hypothetical protein
MYSLNYSRWDEWKPTDEVSLLEEKEAKLLEENRLNAEFENNNPEFCKQFLEDKAKRDEAIKKKKVIVYIPLR